MLGQILKIRMAGAGWRFLSTTTRLHRVDDRIVEAGSARIYACLHRDILPAMMYVEPTRPVLLVSHSPDGDILRRALVGRDFDFVRGSTGKDGRRAFVRLLRVLKEGRSIGVAVDGPRGPAGHIRSGVVQLARLSGCPIVPLTFEMAHCVALRNWDRTRVPLPGCRVEVHPGGSVSIPRKLNATEVDRWRSRLARLLQAPKQKPAVPEAAFE